MYRVIKTVARSTGNLVKIKSVAKFISKLANTA